MIIKRIFVFSAMYMCMSVVYALDYESCASLIPDYNSMKVKITEQEFIDFCNQKIKDGEEPTSDVYRALSQAYEYAGDRQKSRELHQYLLDNNDFAAVLDMAMWYEYGDMGYEKSENKAKEWYLKALDNEAIAEDAMQKARLYRSLGGLYRNYDGEIAFDRVKADEYYSQAIALYEKEMTKGNYEAFSAMGDMYATGYGKRKNILKAIEYYEKSIASGGTRFCRLGDLYMQDGGIESHRKALTKYEIGISLSIPFYEKESCFSGKKKSEVKIAEYEKKLQAHYNKETPITDSIIAAQAAKKSYVSKGCPICSSLQTHLKAKAMSKGNIGLYPEDCVTTVKAIEVENVSKQGETAVITIPGGIQSGYVDSSCIVIK